MVSMKTVSLLLVMILFGLVSESSSRTPTDRCAKYCTCRKTSMRCNGSQSPRGVIPKAPPAIVSVQLDNFILNNLTRAMAANLSHCNLTILFFNGQSIRNVAEDAFQDLTYLRRFKWTQNKISRNDVLNSVSSLNPQLERFQIQAKSSDIQSLDSKMFLKFSSLSHLGLTVRSLTEFNSSCLTHLMSLQNLDLSGNSLNSIIMEKIICNLTDLKLARNNFNTFPPICNQTAMMPRLKDLDISQNAIRVLNVSNVECLKNLLKFTLSNNRIDILPNNGFAGLTKLRSVYMAGLPLTTIEPHAFNSSSLIKLVFTEIPTLSPKRFDPDTLFQNTPNLESLNMMNTKLDLTMIHLKELLLPLKNIKTLNLQRVQITGLPYGLFSKLPKLEKLDLSGNYISNWRKEVFKNVTSVTKLFIDGCNIKMITEESFPLQFRLHIKEINLSNNPFICTCELLWFRNWMKATIANKSIVFTNYPYRYECRSPNTNKLSLKDYNPTAESCKVLEWYVIFLPIFFGTIVIICISGVVVYRYRWYIFYWISLMRRRRQKQYMTPKELKYDAFVSYSNEDNDWVYDELLVYLEGQLGLRLCEHSRDFEGGKLIVDNVFDALDTSGKTILVLSNDYMKSDWCQFELQMALNSFYKHETDLVVVMLEQIQPRLVTSSLRALMTSTTYIEWPPYYQARDIFRERLKNCLLQ